ncbi:restriction endonuclease subunit S [Heyndrickxia sporothermodurans]|uniref:restriction endonuclease subunit S n=1 Tax=Heyndrickxia sporothermodurans TaxID=46224 RepID=UPI002DB6DFF2|nr:restriction endonuclease subunit S [Heyndrickxia sporothermodurans]MEB6548989.1 restriction endonuclease subunit S [Heyndrickxia sporothermodurans]
MGFKKHAAVSLNDVCKNITDGKHGDCKNQENSGYYFVSVKDVFNGKINYEKARQITKEDFDQTHKRTQLEPNDILITNSGTIGRIALALEDEKTYKTTFQKSVAIIKPFPEKVYPMYLYYYLINEIERLKVYAGGTTQKNLLLKDLRNFKVELHDIEYQKSISHFLSSLDEKIEINNQINKKLEEMAQAIFKQWFVDFEFPNENGEPYKSSGGEMVESELGMIPKGWEIKSLDEIAKFLNGLAMQKYRPAENEKGIPVLKIKELRQGATDESSDRCSENIDSKYVIQDGDVIFSWSGSLLVDLWCGGKCGLNQHLFKVTSTEYEKWFYYHWTKFHLAKFMSIAESKATTMGHIKRKDLSDSKVLIPSTETYKKANSIMESILKKQVKTKVESSRIGNIRDNLLPKLMSGEVRVPVPEEQPI